MTSKEIEAQAYPEKGPGPLEEGAYDLPPLEDRTKGRWERSWPTIACGAGLFSDGYLNGVSAQKSLTRARTCPVAIGLTCHATL